MEISLAEKFALTVREASELTGICRDNIYKALHSGALRAKKQGDSTRILPDDLRRWLESLRCPLCGVERTLGECIATSQFGMAALLRRFI